jgi:hypothetical protein
MMGALLSAPLLCTACMNGDLPVPGSLAQKTPLPPQTQPVKVTMQPAPTGLPSALSAADIWVGVDGLSDSLLTISPQGQAQVVDIPLNEGQLASDLVAADGGQRLAYLVWTAEGRQHGIATWNPAEPNARLVAQPEEGFRFVSLFLSGDGSTLVYLLVEDGVLPEQADWRLESVPADGGLAALLTNREALGDVSPPEPFAWPTDGPILLNAAAPDGTSQGIYVVNSVTGYSRPLITPQDETIVIAPALSPDGSQIAYLAYDEDVPQSEGNPLSTNVVRVYNLRLAQAATIAPPVGEVIYGLRWLPDGARLLLDVVRLADEGGGEAAQYWAVVEVGEDSPWESAEADAGRSVLFDYEPYGDGVVYTVLPADDEWNLTWILDIREGGAPRLISLAGIAQDDGAPAILYVP